MTTPLLAEKQSYRRTGEWSSGCDPVNARTNRSSDPETDSSPADRKSGPAEAPPAERRRTMAAAGLAFLASALLMGAAAQQTSPCPSPWQPLGQRCLAFVPVWSSWSAAEAMCSLTGGHLASLRGPQDQLFVRRLTSSSTPVWVGGARLHQNDSWFWSDGSPFTASDWTNQTLEKTGGGGACMQIDPESGELSDAPCGELMFYICSTSFKFFDEKREPVPGVAPGVSLFDVVWSYSDPLAEEILRSSSFIQELWSGHVTPRCYRRFLQQEALYLRRVASTLEALVGRLQEVDDVASLLMDTVKRYGSRDQVSPDDLAPPPQWLVFSLRSYHSVVLEKPVYWLVALAARASLLNFLFEEQPPPERRAAMLGEDGRLYQEWREESLKEVAWTQRFRRLMDEQQDQLEIFKAVNIFREHMMNQKSFYRAQSCDGEDDGHL